MQLWPNTKKKETKFCPKFHTLSFGLTPLLGPGKDQSIGQTNEWIKLTDCWKLARARARLSKTAFSSSSSLGPSVVTVFFAESSPDFGLPSVSVPSFHSVPRINLHSNLAKGLFSTNFLRQVSGGQSTNGRPAVEFLGGEEQKFFNCCCPYLIHRRSLFCCWYFPAGRRGI